MSKTISSLLYGMIAGASTLIGIVLLLRQEKRAVLYSHYFKTWIFGKRKTFKDCPYGGGYCGKYWSACFHGLIF